MPDISAGVRTTSGTPEATAMVHAITHASFLRSHHLKFQDCSRGHRLTSARFNGYIQYVKAQVH